MNTKEAFRALVGGALVYVAMAACGGPDNRYPGQQSGLGFSPGAGAGGAASDSGLLDALINPVTEAAAQVPDAAAPQADAGPVGPQIDDVPCDTTLIAGGTRYALKNYPGLTVADLSRVVALSHQTAGAWVAEGFVWSQAAGPVRFRDGAAIVACGVNDDYVRFVKN